jgi:Tol biopolymer transport system component
MEASVSRSYVAPSDSSRFTFFNNKTTRFTTVRMSPDGRYIAYAENDRGRFIVKVREFGTEKEKVIISGGSKVIEQRVDYNIPLISWADDHTLGVIGLKNGQYVFWLYDLSTKTKLPRELDRFSNIRSFDFSGNGRLVILSADFEGQNDLFLLSSRRDRVRRLTNDVFDDLDPSFVPNSNSIVFSSNRTSDTLVTGKKLPITMLTNNYNLFSYDLDSSRNVLTRLTNTLSKDYAPTALDNNTFIFLSDQRGIVNLFKFNRTTGIYSQITNYPSGIRQYDFNSTTRRLSIVTMKNLKENIYVHYDFNLNRQVFTPATRRKELQQAQFLRDRRKQEEETKRTMSVKDLLNERLKESQNKTDSADVESPAPADTLSGTQVQSPVASGKQPGQNTINTDDYKFEEETPAAAQPSDTFMSRFMKAREQTRVTGPFPYEPKFGYDNLVTSLVVDPIRGLGIKIETQMNDMLENYRFFGGIMTSIDLRNGDAFAEVQYLPAYIDFSARFDRKGIRREPQEDGNEYRYILHKIEVGAAMPLSDRTRVTLKPFIEFASSVDLGPTYDFSGNPPPEDILTNTYAGLRSEVVYDNSVVSGLNIIEGTRAKASFVHHQGINSEDISFSNVSVDIRHYQKIYKEIVFAVRGFGGTFFGRAPKTYFLGGMDNWFFNESRTDGTSSQGQPNPLGMYTQNQDLLFSEFATNLRGFDYATLFGNSVLLLNAELRLPLARAFAAGPITSNFFRNMQFTAFYDIGSSWSGPPPFKSDNSVSYKIIENGPFVAQLKNYLNPWLYSYGFGFRSVMLGYYLKADLAWPVENYKVRDPRFMVTLGFDF